MARIAGSKSYYTIGLIDHKGKPTGIEYQFDSVTSVLDVISKPSLMHWYYKMGLEGFVTLYQKYGGRLPSDFESVKSLMSTEKLSPYHKRNAAADLGSDIHEDLESLCAGKAVKPRPENVGLLNWWEERGLHSEDIIASERPLVSFKWRVAGTPDIVYRNPNDDAITLADLKTGKHIAWTHFVQGESYRAMAAETTDWPAIDRVSVLHVRPPGEEAGEKGWRELLAPEITVANFEAALQIYRGLPVKWHPEDMDERLIV